MELTRGGNVPLPAGAMAGQPVEVLVRWQPPAGIDIDTSAFLLTANGRVRSDDDMVFYNQPASPCGAVKRLDKTAGATICERFAIDLARIPADIAEVAFTMTLPDGAGISFQAVRDAQITVQLGSDTLCRYALTDVGTEVAIILGKLYRHGGSWKFRAVGQGFNGGLAALATSFGITVEEPASPPPVPTPPAPTVSVSKINLDKKLEQQAPQLLSLAKKAEVSLSKVNLAKHRAKVALCLDISGSMGSLYSSGAIQRFAEKILALGTRFDDDGAIDLFLFGAKAHDVGEMGIDNFGTVLKDLLRRYPLEGGTNYAKAMTMIRAHYFPDGQGQRRSTPVSAELPVYVMFLTDGQTSDERSCEEQLRWSSYEPIFWQFMGIGKSSKDAAQRGFFARLLATDFSFLERLDTLDGRHVDNANFFSVESPEALSDEALYDRLMAEYPDWVKQAPGKGLIR